MRLSEKALILILVPLLFEIVFVISLTQLLRETELAAQRESRSRAIVAHVNDLLRLVLESSLTATNRNSEVFASDSKMGSNSSMEEVQQIKALVKDRPDEAASMGRIEEIITKAMMTMKSTKEHLAAGDNFALLTEARRLRPLVQNLSLETNKLIDAEQRRQALLPITAAGRREQVQQMLTLGVFLNILLAFSLVAYFNFTTAARLATLMRNTKKMAAGESLEPQLEGRDEIAAVDNVFHEMAKTIRQAEQMKEEFLAMITHDLRSPLSSIEGTLANLGEGVYDDDAEKRKARILTARANVSRLLRLVNDLLDLEKLRAGMLPLDVQQIKIKEVLEKSIEALVPAPEQSPFQLSLPSELPEIEGDQQRLVQVMINLLSNAQKYSPAGETIEVGCTVNDGTVEITVSDRGAGIPEDQRSLIFEKFMQASERLDKDGKPTGTGLGLAICKSIVIAHGGTIGVKQNQPCGSVFWIQLPVKQRRNSVD